MTRVLNCAVAFAVALSAPAVSLAQHAAPAPAYHAAAPAYHPAAPAYHPAAPVYHPPPVSRPANPGGFSFPQHDLNARPPQIHPAPVHATAGYHVMPQQSTVRTNTPRIPYATGPYRNWRGPIVNNPRRWRGWQWNRGVIWFPVPYYWGGGFWGPWVIGATGAALVGSVVDYDDHEIFASYDAESNSPGAQLLTDYGLTQTECGPPNLVVIWGPNNSVVCAYPNDVVSPGNYELDPETLTIQSLTAPATP